MRKSCFLALAITGLAIFSGPSRALDSADYTFLLSAQAVAIPPRVTISWPAKSVPQIHIRRKLPADNGWGAGVVTLPGTATSYTDTSVEFGKAYEYEFQAVIEEQPRRQVAFGYICVAIHTPAVERRGKVALMVDSTQAGALGSELETLRRDLVGDGWVVVRHDVAPHDSVQRVKSIIKAEHSADPSNMRAVFLLGRIPVPYSGLINPDMHRDHLGAWPADVFYGDMAGIWTDQSVNKNDAGYGENNNVPGDGKFDQSTIPGPVALEVGRVDMSRLSSFPRSETELLRNYLNKNHRFRHRTLTAPLRGLIRDNFGVISDDAPAVDAWRAFPSLFGRENVREVGPDQFFSTLATDAYLWAYAGGGGDWEKADGVGGTVDFVNGDPKAIFYLLHGSYFGDWNNTDNFLRAAIATPNYGLVSIWSSLPHWHFHHLAVGETIGFATRLIQNNRAGLYRNQVDLSVGEIHISMMGDPTLRSFPLAPPSNLRVAAGEKMVFQWDPSWQNIDGYILYWSANPDGPWTRLSRALITGTRYEYSLPAPGRYYYMLKAVALQNTGSGSFNNLSQGAFAEHETVPLPTPQISIAAVNSTTTEGGPPLSFQLTRNTRLDSTLLVNLEFGGSSTYGADYQSATTLTFPAGSATTDLLISPVQDSLNEFDETVIVTVLPGAGYNLAAANRASGVIQGSGECRIVRSDLGANTFGFTATGFAGRNYRIESRTQTEPWRQRAAGTAGGDGSVTYSGSPDSGPSEWFRIVWE